MHFMRVHFQARCFAFFAGGANALTQEPNRAIDWDGVYAHYYNESFLDDTDKTEEKYDPYCSRPDAVGRGKK